MIKPLVELAKELGIRPNPDLTVEDWVAIKFKIGRHLLSEKTGLPETDRHEIRRKKYPANLNDHVYTLHKYLNRHWSERTINKAEQIMLKDKDTRKDVMVHVSQIGFQDFEDTPYIWHTTSESGRGRERFTVDLDLSSPQLAQAIEAMDKFITKYKAKFKLSNHNSLNRCDTMNVYIPTDITPEMARDLYQAVAPALSRDNHERLSGVDIFMDGQPVRGIKIGPESPTAQTKEEEEEFFENQRDKLYNTLYRDVRNSDLQDRATEELTDLIADSSLSQKCIALEIADLLYYAIGKEGKSPFLLRDYDGNPYRKHIDFPAPPIPVKEVAGKTQNPHFWERLFPVSRKKTPEPNWKKSENWSNVVVQQADGSYACGHRINLGKLSSQERGTLEKTLRQLGIEFTERRATQPGQGIQVGDETLRVSHPDSIRRLRQQVFSRHFTTNRPIVMSQDEYRSCVSKRASGSLNRLRGSGR